jgi:hypothetical protein
MFAPAAESLIVLLSADYAVNAALAVWSHAMLNTDVFALPSKPAWFDGVAGHIKSAKETTEPWLNKDYPQIAAALPQSLIDYGIKFVNIANEMIPLVAKPLSADDRETLVDLLEELKKEATTQQFRVKGLQKKVETFTAFANQTAATLAKDQKDVMATIKDKSEGLTKLQSRIIELYRELGVSETEAKNQMAGAAMKGLSIAGSLFVYSIATAVTATASAPIISVGIGIIALTYAAIVEKAHSESVLSKIREITELQAKIPVEQQQAASLQAVVASMETLSDLTRMSQTNMAGSVHYWDDITSGLALALELLEKEALDPTTLTPFKTLAGAKATWQKILEAARNVQSSVFNVQPPVVVKGEAA